MSGKATIEGTLSTSDRGDDINRRFRYQAAYAAILALGMLNNETEFEEIFCEHHEDILIKRKDGKIIAVQVKTRLETYTPFKARDETILDVIKKFVFLDREFPGQIERFVIATNIGFWGEKNDKQNLSYILSAQEKSNGNVFLEYAQLIKKHVNDINVTEAEIIDTITKIHLDGNLPKLDNYKTALSDQLGKVEGCKHLSILELHDLADDLISVMLEASAKSIDAPIRSYIAYLENPAESLQKALIENKRVTKEIINATLNRHSVEPDLLTTWDNEKLSDLAKGYKKLELKMGAGNISTLEVGLLKDHKASTELLLSNWLYKYDLNSADKQYKHIKTLVRTHCQEAYTENKKIDSFFGEDMLVDIRRRLKKCFEEEKDNLFGIRYEHLFGFVGILTEECKVWWSEKFDISEAEF